METLLQIAGVAIIGLALTDLYLGVLQARTGMRPVAGALNPTVWSLLKLVARKLGAPGKQLVTLGGSLLIVLDVVTWGTFLVVGFALVIWPELGTSIQATGTQPTPTNFAAALYYAGYSLTTLGTGDLVPKSDLMRVLMVVKAGLGFSYITLSVTYVMSIYAALRRRTTLGLSLHLRTDRTGDASCYLSRLLAHGTPDRTEQDLSVLANWLVEYYEDHQFYPILHYFHFHQTYYGSPRILYTALDTATLARSALEPNEYRWLLQSSSLTSLWFGGLHLLQHLPLSSIPDRSNQLQPDPSAEDLHDWQNHYQAAVRRLQQAGITCRAQDGWTEYVALRQQWNADVCAFCRHMQDDWSQVAVTQP